MKPMLAVKLKNQILRAARKQDLPLDIKLHNISINGEKRGCSGFVQSIQSGSCVYINTEKSATPDLADKNLYRYARDMKDFSSNCLANGENHFCTDEELAQRVIDLLRRGAGKPR